METGSLGLGASLSIRGRRVVRGFALGPEFSVDQLYQFFLIEFVGSSILFLSLPEDSDRFAQLLQVQVGSPELSRGLEQGDRGDVLRGLFIQLAVVWVIRHKCL